MAATEATTRSSPRCQPCCGGFPQIREWLGDRVIKQLRTQGFAVKNKKFEVTVSVKRTDIEDDKPGIYGPMFEQAGYSTKCHPDEMIFSLLGKGFTENCYDGQFFFDSDHPTFDGSGDQTGTISNMQAGSAPPWYLLDVSRAIKPMIWQKRTDYVLTALDNDRDRDAFFRDEYIYGVRARANAGFGLWQFGFGSKAALTVDNYKLARAAMMGFRSDTGRRLGITPNLLVVPPELEEAGRTITKASQISSTSNVWQDSVDLLVTHYLD